MPALKGGSPGLNEIEAYIGLERAALRYLAWIIHKSRLLQMQGTGDEAVVLHRECPVTKQVL